MKVVKTVEITKESDVKRRMDRLGRIVLPRAIQNKLGLYPGAEIVMTEEDGVVRITAAQSDCKICGQTISDSRPLCGN